MRAFQPPWSVNALAQAAAVTALSDQRHRARSLRFMLRERAWLTRRLSRVPALKVFPSGANFLLLEISGHAREATAALRRQGVLIRDCSAVSGLTVGTLRVAVKTRAENTRLVELLGRFLGEGE
jgi:threonine-phosphate decarboxylase